MYETVALFLLHRILLSFWNSDSSASVFSRLNLRNVRDQQNLLVPGGLRFLTRPVLMLILDSFWEEHFSHSTLREWFLCFRLVRPQQYLFPHRSPHHLIAETAILFLSSNQLWLRTFASGKSLSVFSSVDCSTISLLVQFLVLPRIQLCAMRFVRET